MDITFSAANTVGLNNPGTEIITLVKDGSGNFINPPSYDKMRAYLRSGEVPMLFVTDETGDTGSLYQLVEYSETENKIRFSNDTSAIEFCAGCEVPVVSKVGGGGGDDGAKEFRLVQSITLEEQSDRVDISVDSNGNAFALHEVYVMLAAQSYGNAENVTFLPNGSWTSEDAYIISSDKSSSSTDTWRHNMTFHSVYADGIILSEQLPAKGQNNNLTTSFAAGQAIITKISIVSKFAAGCTFLVIGR